MSEELTNEAINSAILLEGRVNERVEKEVNRILDRQMSKIVKSEVNNAFAEYKQAMMMEISITVGKIMRNTEEENRKPLWASTPEELGLMHKDLNSHMLGKSGDHGFTTGDIDAIRKQT
jgi:hypothetical protein